SAEQIIQHHHFMWRHLSLPQGRSVTLLTTDELLATI
ncbi:MAG: cysteine hydrolase, partial [Aeromonas sp.]|nr:cysteine hydrolase [Aeromonas sp.]